MNETGTTSEGVSLGKYSSAQQRGTGRYQATARIKWTKQVNIVVMECYYRSRPEDENGIAIRAYGRRMFRGWRERGTFESTEQRIPDQARAIRKNGWLSELEVETIRRGIEQEGEETHEMENVTRSADIDQNVVDDVEGVLENGKNVDFVVNETGDIPPEERTIIDQIREIIAEGLGNNHGFSFKKVDKKRLEEETRKVNKAFNQV